MLDSGGAYPSLHLDCRPRGGITTSVVGDGQVFQQEGSRENEGVGGGAGPADYRLPDPLPTDDDRVREGDLGNIDGPGGQEENSAGCTDRIASSGYGGGVSSCTLRRTNGTVRSSVIDVLAAVPLPDPREDAAAAVDSSHLDVLGHAESPGGSRADVVDGPGINRLGEDERVAGFKAEGEGRSAGRAAEVDVD